MKLLLCVNSLTDIQPFLEATQVQPVPVAGLSFLHTTKILQHETDILETGAGVFQTTYKLTKALSRQKYHLALKLSTGNAYKADYAPGSILNIINEKPGDYGMPLNGEWKDFYDLNLLNRETEPHVRGGYINLTNAYMNVFMPYKKAVGITVNNYADKTQLALRLEKYRADCETTDGLGFTYTCLYEKQSFYHLCFTGRNLATGEENYPLALEVLNKSLKELIEKL